MGDQEELSNQLCSTYFNGIDGADIEKGIEGLKKDVEHKYHICVAARPIRHSVSPLIIQL